MEQRTPIMSRTYQKGAGTQQIFVAKLSGGDIDGDIYQYEVFLDGQEQLPERITTGNRDWLRDKFIKALQQLSDEGWKRVADATHSHPESKFFDPEPL